MTEKGNWVLSRLEAAGFEAYYVGGCVRDRLMGMEPHDYDITTSALPEEVETVFADCRLIETGLQHGTVTLVLDGEPFELTTFRVETTYSDHRHPDAVRFTRTLRDDLSRRDFTMNAIAMDRSGALADPFHGEEDIAAGMIRCVGDPMLRFEEDALRILRALRFSAVLGFSIEAKTREAIFAKKALLSHVSHERIFAELNKMLCGANAGSILQDYFDVITAVLPELAPMKGFDQRNYHHIYDVLEHTARVVDAVPQEKALRWAALFHDAGKPAVFSVDENGVGHFYGHADVSRGLAASALHRLRCDNAAIAMADLLIRYHDTPIECTPKAVRRALGKLTPEGFLALMQLKRADNLAQSPEFRSRQKEIDALAQLAEQIQAEAQCFRLKDLAINGHDLLALGYLPGRKLGTTLQSLFDAVLNDSLPNDRETLLEAAKREMDQ